MWHRVYSGINPYALEFAMYTDIQRICEHPTDEDRRWFPDIAGAPWLPTLDHAMRNYKDESLIGQFLSPKLMRDFRLFSIHDDEKQHKMEVGAIHDEAGYGNCGRLCHSNTIWARANPISKSGTSTCGVTAH